MAALELYDGIRLLTQTAGTGAYQLGGAPTGYLNPFTVKPAGFKSTWRCESADGSLWEVFEGTLSPGSPATLSRDRIARTSVGNAVAINWPDNSTKRVSLVQAADRIAYLGDDGFLDQAVLGQAKISQLYSGSTFSVPNNTEYNVPFNQFGVNTLGAHPTANPAYALTAPAGGIYRATLNLTFANNTTGQRLAYIKIDGTVRAMSRVTAATGDCDVSLSWEGPITTGKLVQAFVLQTSGAALSAGGTTQTNLTLTRL